MIYCVEDDASIRELVVYTLQATGYEAQCVCRLNLRNDKFFLLFCGKQLNINNKENNVKQ